MEPTYRVIIFRGGAGIDGFYLVFTQQAMKRELRRIAPTPGAFCAASPSVEEEKDKPLPNASFIRPFPNLAPNRGINFARQKPVSDCMSKLYGDTRAGDPSSLGNRAYSANHSLRIPLRASRNIRLFPSSTKSMKFRTVASNAICTTSGAYKTSRRRFNSSSKARAFPRSVMCSSP